MALFDEEELPNATRVNNVPEVEKFQTARVNTEEQPVGTLLTHIGGMRWIPRFYFSRVLGKDEEVESYQGKLLPINRQYKVIHDLEIKVQTAAPNNPTVDEANQEFTVRGTARMYPNSVIPNPGDMIIGDTPDGRQAIYQVCDRVVPLQIFKKTAYEFDYVMYSWWKEDIEKEMMRGKVAEYHFVRDNIDSGLNPLINDEDWGTWTELEDIRDQFPMKFNTRFISRDFGVYMVPGQSATVYDPFHAGFCNLMFKPNGVSISNGANLIPVEDGSNDIRLTIHSAVLTLNKSLLDVALLEVPIIGTRTYLAEPYLGGIRFSGARYVVYPPQSTAALHSGLLGSSYSVFALNNHLMLPVRRKKSEQNNPVPTPPEGMFKSVIADDYYIFSEEFYFRENGNMSEMEVMMWQMLDNNTVDPKRLIEMFKQAEYLPVLDQFYLMPFLYSMIHSGFRGV